MSLPFSEICTLLQRHEDIVSRHPPILDRATKGEHHKAVTESWFKSHRLAIDQLDVEASVALLSTLLPETRTDRVYGLGAHRLLHIISRGLGLSSSRTKDLNAFRQPGAGDLGQCLERVLRGGGPPGRPAVRLDDVDEMLQVLAGGCRFSDPSVQRLPSGSSEARDTLIANILKRLQPWEAKWLVRLTLKDFTPVRLNEQDVLKGFHFLLPGVLRFQDHFTAAVGLLKGALREYPSHVDHRSERLHCQSAATKLRPTVGVKVGRPNFHKARGIEHCMRMLGNTHWVLERKYDGEYCEIHVDLSKHGDPRQCITIFSKSGKNSTKDRQELIPTLVESLRLGRDNCKIQRRAILLGEMVVYSDTRQVILPFDEIRKHVLRSGSAIGTDADSFPKAGEHLALVFFDMLLFDDEILMDRPIDERRQWLREVYRKRPGYAMGSEWKIVDFSTPKPARRLLGQQFAASVAKRCEGLVLKPCGVPYFSLDNNPASYSHSYIKLKKDYMKDMGDEADFAVIGGSYDARQAAICGVGGVKWTQFHLGCLLNKDDVVRFDARPRFKVVGSIQQEHCIPKAILQAANALGQFCASPYKAGDQPADFDLENAAGCKIDAMFSAPFVFEVLGSGFEKPSNCNFLMLRHPRVTKLHADRTFKDAISTQELHDQAEAARSAAADSESQETRMWMAKLEDKSRKKLERERLATPKSRTTGTQSTNALSTGRTRVASTAPGSRAPVQKVAQSLQEAPDLDGTTLIGSPSALAMKRPRSEVRYTPCPAAKRLCTERDVPKRPLEALVSRTKPLADITNQAPTTTTKAPPPSSETGAPSLLKRLSGLSKPAPTLSRDVVQSKTRSHCPGQSSCALHNSTIHLSPCISNTPYIAIDLLSPHIMTGCITLTTQLKHWRRDAGRYPPLADAVSESPAWKGRRKILFVEGRREAATMSLVREALDLGLGWEKIEVWDWRVLDERCGSQGMDREWLLGMLDCRGPHEGCVEGREWLARGVAEVVGFV